jgi:hypothetical protein
VAVVNRSVCPTSDSASQQWLCRIFNLGQNYAFPFYILLCFSAKTMPLSFNRMQSRVVTGLRTGHNTMRRHLDIMGLTVPCVGNVQQRRRPQLMFCVSVKSWRHSDILTWVPCFLTLRTLELKVWGNLELY